MKQSKNSVVILLVPCTEMSRRTAFYDLFKAQFSSSLEHRTFLSHSGILDDTISVLLLD